MLQDHGSFDIDLENICINPPPTQNKHIEYTTPTRQERREGPGPLKIGSREVQAPSDHVQYRFDSGRSEGKEQTSYNPYNLIASLRSESRTKFKEEVGLNLTADNGEERKAAELAGAASRDPAKQIATRQRAKGLPPNSAESTNFYWKQQHVKKGYTPETIITEISSPNNQSGNNSTR